MMIEVHVRDDVHNHHLLDNIVLVTNFQPPTTLCTLKA